MKIRRSAFRKKVLFVYNPHAGKAKIKNYLYEILDIFAKAGFEVTAYPTQEQKEAVGIVIDCVENYDMLVCSGGDGTLDEVVTGMLRSGKNVPIGYLPAGSTNDFATSLMIPKNMIKAAWVIAREKLYPCDIGRFNKDVFVYIAAFGLFTNVSYETKQEVKNVLGHLAYVLEGMKHFNVNKSYHIHLKSDEIEIEDDFMFGMITNSTSVGGFKKITGKCVDLNDGLFEVTLIKKPKNPAELNHILSSLMGKNINTEYMYCFKSAKIQIVSEEEISWTLDGEFGGKHKEVIIQNENKAIQIIVP